MVRRNLDRARHHRSSPSQSPKGKKKATNYYPLKPGTKWTYQVDAGGRKEVEVSNQIVKDRNDRWQVNGPTGNLLNGNVVATEHLTSTAEGVFAADITGSRSRRRSAFSNTR